MIKKTTKLYPLLLSILIHLALITIFIGSIIHIKNPKIEERFISLKNIQIDKVKRILPIEKVIPRKKIEQKQKKIMKLKKRVLKKMEKKKIVKKKVLKKILKKEINKVVKKKVYPLISKPISKETFPPQRNSIKKEHQDKRLIVTKKSKIAITTKEEHMHKEFSKLNLSKILASIDDEKFYPRRARKLHIEGIVIIKFLLKKDGSVKILNISSNQKYLKKASIKILNRASKFFPKPSKDTIIKVPIEFRLLS